MMTPIRLFLAISLCSGALLGCAANVVDPGASPGGVGRTAGPDGSPTGGASSDSRAPDRPVALDTSSPGSPRDGAAADAPAREAPPPAPAGCGLENVVTRTFFDSIYPAAGRNAVFTYEGLVEAAQAFPDFIGTGDMDACRREAAAFLANVSHETGNLRFVEQIAKDHYCQSQGRCPCDPAATDQSTWYYGRGAIQLSWNYNYCAAGIALGVPELATTPSLVSTRPDLAWKTAIWFWMRGATSCHQAMQPGGGGFGATIRIINGGVECGKGGFGVEPSVTQRVNRYLDYARRLGITDPGTPESNGC
jgi:predicted chitinase